jgi:hypothetical protein
VEHALVDVEHDVGDIGFEQACRDLLRLLDEGLRRDLHGGAALLE